MTSEELKDWLQFHDAVFPGFLDWFRAAESAELLQVRARLWQGRLAPYSGSQTKKQTEAMFASREKPKFWSEHLDWIMNRLCPRPLLNDTGNFIAKCELCNGTGIVSVVFFQQRYTPGGHPLPGNRGPAACKCAKGKWLNDRRQEHPDGTALPWYESSKMQADVAESITGEELLQCRRRLGDKNSEWFSVIDKIGMR